MKKWSPVKRGIVAALVVWGVLGTGEIFMFYMNTLFHSEHDRNLPNDPKFVSFFALLNATEAGDITAARIVLEKGANPNLEPPFDEDESYCPPLLMATMKHNKPMVKLLLDYKADPTRGDVWEERDVHSDPVIEAATNNDIEILDMLLQRGGGSSKDSALWQAAVAGKREAVVFLLEQDANSHQVINGVSLCQAVLEKGHPEIVSLLEKASSKGKR